MSDKKFCLDLDLNDLMLFCDAQGVPKYRAGQIFSWLSKGVVRTSDMNNIPKDIRAALEETYIFEGFDVIHKFVSEIDGTTKFVYRLWDDNVIETVVMPYKTGLSVCISSQAGCKMGCRFCASADAGFGRSLSAGELFGQVTVTSRQLGEKISSVVVMGIGEPFDNYDNLISFIDLATSADGLNLGARHITVSTCGLVPMIDEFADRRSYVNLAISLHAPSDELRSKIMPINRRYNIGELIPACVRYTEITGRRITFEYSLFAGVNDDLENARALVSLLKGMLCHVNLIAANEFPGSDFKRSPRENVERFKDYLNSHGINATLRREMGTDIMAACGQLRRSVEGKSC